MGLKLSIVLVGRNDDYGGGFNQRLFRSTDHNFKLLRQANIELDVVLVEWNPVANKGLLAELFLQHYDFARAIVVPASVHAAYNCNPNMQFHEMPAKNVGIRRAQHAWILTMNAEVMLDEVLVERLLQRTLDRRVIYRAHRIDVTEDLAWSAMKDPANQIESSEGRLPPCDYLGAAGDFILAHRDVWDALKGFNETIRFSTRCKDWQFLLQAKQAGYAIETLGRVYHLEHAVGFRNTPAAIRDSELAHFGQLWDIEFEMSKANSPTWGMAGSTATVAANERLTHLPKNAYTVGNADGIELAQWQKSALTAGEATTHCAGAYILHSLLLAHRAQQSLCFRVSDMRALVTLDGLAAIAQQWGIRVYCEHDLRCPSGYRLSHLQSLPANASVDWIVEERAGQWSVNGEEITRVLPHRCAMDAPAYNPLLLRRLCALYLRLAAAGETAIDVFGAGSHTRELLAWGVPDAFALERIVMSAPSDATWQDLPVVTIAAYAGLQGQNALVVSSNSFEMDMLAVAAQHRIKRVYPMYSNWG